LLLTHTATSIQQYTAKIASYFERELLAIFTLDENPKNAKNSVVDRQKILTDAHRFSATVPRLKTLANVHKVFRGSFSDRLSGCQGVEIAKKGDF
jgi:hypothetical protein